MGLCQTDLLWYYMITSASCLGVVTINKVSHF